MSVISHKNLIAPLFEAVSSRPGQNLNADIFALAMLDTEGKRSELFCKSQGQSDIKSCNTIKNEIPRIWHSCKENSLKTIIIGVDNSEGERPESQLLKTFSCEVALGVPFEIENAGGGILIYAWQTTPDGFPDAYIERARLITEQIRLSLRLALNEKRSKELSIKLASLLELSTAVYSTLNHNEVLEKALHLSQKIIGADGGSIFIYIKKDNLLKPLVTVDRSHEAEISQVTLRPGEGITGLVAQSGKGLISNHSESDPRAFQVPGTPEEPESLISVPLTASGEVIGVITLRSYNGRQFVQEDLDILTIFARQTADAIQNARLFESLETAYQELSSTQEQLVMTEKLRALGEMAGGVAHDFNNVLGTILGRTQLLLKEMENSPWIDYLKQIEQVTLAGARTVQKLQNFTRISGHGQLESVDLGQVVANAIEVTKPRWKDECQLQGINIDLEFNCTEMLPISGNKSELEEAVANLILNAVDALSEGGYIKISAYMDNGRAFVKVEDNGEGMADATLNRVFYPFFTTKGLKSTGMGLAVVYGIVTRHNGEIDVKSKLGEGTTCTVQFPCVEIIRPDDEEPVEIKKPVRARILLIDDDENIRDVMTDMLELMGHDVTAAESGERGVDILKKGNFDLIITDLGMPGISGWEVIRISKSLRPGIPVIMVSGWGNQLDDELVNQSGLDAIMSKPFDINKIKDLVQQVLAKRSTASVDSSPNGR